MHEYLVPIACTPAALHNNVCVCAHVCTYIIQVAPVSSFTSRPSLVSYTVHIVYVKLCLFVFFFLCSLSIHSFATYFSSVESVLSFIQTVFVCPFFSLATHQRSLIDLQSKPDSRPICHLADRQPYILSLKGAPVSPRTGFKRIEDQNHRDHPITTQHEDYYY